MLLLVICQPVQNTRSASISTASLKGPPRRRCSLRHSRGRGPALPRRLRSNVSRLETSQTFIFPTAASYVSHGEPLAETVLQKIKMGGLDHPTFWIGSEFIDSFAPFSLTGTLEAGILNNMKVECASFVLDEHQYSGFLNIGAVRGGPLPGTLMNEASIQVNLSTVYYGLVNTHSYQKT